MIDINEAPDKTAATLEKFLENCEMKIPISKISGWPLVTWSRRV